MGYSDKIEDAISSDDVLLTFLLHLGDSTNGQVGTCVRAIAKTPSEAVDIAKDALEDRSAENRRGYKDVGRHDVEYVANYYNVDAISEEDIIESETHIYDVLQKEEALRGDYE